MAEEQLILQANSADKKGYVVAGAILKCSFGTQPTRLKRPFSHGVYIKDKAQMNVSDYLPGDNISGFGRCFSLTNPAVLNSNMVDIYGVKKAPCIPMITKPWIGGKKDVLVEGQASLTDQCSNSCLYCGFISIENDGQNLD